MKFKTFYVIAGAPRAQSHSAQIEVLYEFQDWSRSRGGVPCGYYFDETLSRAWGGRALQLGKELRLSLRDFSLKGKSWAEARRAKNKGIRENWSVEINLGSASLPRAQKLHQRWRSKKGPLTIEFLLANLAEKQTTHPSEKFWFLKDDKGTDLAMLSFLSYVDPLKGKSAYIDQMIFDPKASRLALSSLLVTFFEKLKSWEYEQVNLGLCPFAMDQAKGIEEGLLRSLYAWNWPYNAQGLHQFKTRFATEQSTQYLFMDDSVNSWKQLYVLARVTLNFKSLILPLETKAPLSG